MWHSMAVLAAIITLVPAASLAGIGEDAVEAQLQEELWEIEHEGRHQSHRIRHKHFLGLLGHHNSPLPPSGLNAPVATDLQPAVVMKTQHKDKDTFDVKGKQHVAVQMRSNLVGEVKQTIQHLNSIADTKQQLARTAVLIRVEAKKLKRLQVDKLRVEKTHHRLSSSLRHIMGPKIKYAQRFLLKKNRKMHEFEAQDAEWKNKEESFHAAALATLEERSHSKTELEAALLAEKKAHDEREAAEKRLDTVKRSAKFNVEGFMYSKEKERGAMSKKLRGKEQAVQAQVAVKRLTKIFNLEQHHVDQTMNIGKIRVQHKIQKLEVAEEASKAKLEKLRQQYIQWQEQQEVLAAQLTATRQGTESAAKDFANSAHATRAKARRAHMALDNGENGSDWAWDASPGSADAPDAL